MNKLLVIHSEANRFRDVWTMLKSRYEVVASGTVQNALELLRTQGASAVILDYSFPDISCDEVVHLIHREIDPHLPVIAIADHSDLDHAVAAMREGAYDFITKDIDPDHLALKILKALERRDLEIRLKTLERGQAQQQNSFIFASDVMKMIDLEITRLARLEFDVLLIGETGVGKDLIAWQIHRRSPRSKGPFVPVVMRTFSETLIESELFGHERGAFSGAERAKIGKFEAANGGTIYIPEVSCLDETTQLKLQYFMQYKCVSRVGQDPRRSDVRLDVRLIMATNDNLEELVRKRKLREDFYHRIAGVRLSIPPLRERVQDIEPLAQYFLETHSGRKRGEPYDFAEETLTGLKGYQWPGNVRELENTIKNALSYSEGPILHPHHFPVLSHPFGHACPLLASDLHDLPSYQDADRHFKRDYFQRVWELSEQNVGKAATIARMTPQGVRKILRALHLT
ncbi:MAG: sigma-54-dependent transcriptional regulator [Bacteroidota bacterium]